MTITLRATKGSALSHNELDGNFTDLDGRVTTLEAPNVIFVTQANIATTLGGTIDSTVEYFLTGILDPTGVEVTVPAGGLYITGLNADISGLVSTEAAATLFSGATAGPCVLTGMHITMSGAGSQVFDITAALGTEPIEFERVDFIDCSSLGEISGYLQLLETNTGRFGGTPDLTLAGTWGGGYFIETSIVRGLTAGSYSLFSAGVSFTMASRFRSNQNIDLPAGVSFFDFAPANFLNTSTVQLNQVTITRAGAFDSADALYTPNMAASDLSSEWRGNVGMPNTFIGGTVTITSTAITALSVGVSAPIQGTFTPTDLQHMDSPANGQLRHLGDSGLEYIAFANSVIEDGAGNVLDLIVEKSTDGGVVFSEVKSQEREVLNLSGAADVAIYGMRTPISLDLNDRVRLAVRNTSNSDDATAHVDTALILQRRS